MNQDSKFISETLISWYEVNKRDLPWRQTKDPYRIWISEIILQQTRVAQGYDYYMRFIETFPNVKTLATADEDKVLKLWQGLGYYSRARNIHTAAKTIVSEYKGIFPTNYKDILSLKGIGEYTAAAIASAAFELPHAVVDGNVYRVLSRLFSIDTPIDTTTGKKLFTELANELIDNQRPGTYNQAIMDFGALQCSPISPSCDNCPFAEKCMAYAQNSVSKYPVKQNKTKVKERYFNYLDIHCRDYTYISKRTGNDIWKNLYELPLVETDKDMSLEELEQNELFKEILKDAGNISIRPASLTLKHVLSHRIIYAKFYKIEVEDDILLQQQFIKIKKAELENYAISRLVDRYFEQQSTPDLFI